MSEGGKMATNYEVRHEANEASRTRAAHHGEIWEAFEIELLEEGWSADEATLPEIAELLGRTIEACRQKHYDLQRRPVTNRQRKLVERATDWDRGFTSLEAMGF